jgi:hypothetical protein
MKKFPILGYAQIVLRLPVKDVLKNGLIIKITKNVLIAIIA